MANTTLHRPRTNSSSTHSLNVGSMPGVVRGDAAGQAVEEVVVAEDVQVVVGQVPAALLDERVDLVALLRRGQPEAGRRGTA